MKSIGYLINQHPMASTTFVRREIAAHEAAGYPIRRYAVRAWETPLVDPADIEEMRRTRRILDEGLPRLLASLAKTLATRPGPTVRALSAASRLARRSTRGALRHLIYLAEACVLREWAEADRIDHLHVHFGSNSAAVAMLSRLLGGPPYSFTVHGPEDFDAPVALSLGEKVAHSTFAVGISSYTRSQLWRWADPADWSKVEVIHCGLEADYIDAAPTPPDPAPRFLNIGRLVEQKGQLLLVEAAALLKARGRDFEVNLIGGGPLEGPIRDRIRELGLETTVRLLGWKTGDEVKAELIRSRALVLPSFAEGLPVVLMEALAMGRPVLSTYIAGIPELVRPGETGWLVPAGSAACLADAMEAALDASPDQLARMGLAGAELVRARHDVRIEAGKLRERIEREGTPGQSSRVD